MAAVVEVPRVRATAGSEWARKYPPLFAILVALVIALLVMPSALNVPQTNPTQTLEFAPVPPKDDEPPPPPQGNLSSLGLAGSSSVEGPGAEGGNSAVTIPPLTGKNPTSKRCVGNPPRQTENPVAPPCVAYFKGDNFGATYQGVTKDEIRLLIYIDGNIAETNGSKAREPRPTETYFDLFKPPNGSTEEHTVVKGFRAWQRYFNDRFQTYNRVVHFYMYFTGFDHAPENRRADAADNFANIHPFAVLTDANENEIDYVESMAKKGVLNFGSFSGKPNEFYKKFPKLIWGYQPSLEIQAEEYANYVCTKVVKQPVALDGNNKKGQPRKLALMHTSDENWPGLLLLADLVKQKVEGCGGEFASEVTFPVCCFNQDAGTPPDYAVSNVAEMQQKGVTTVLWTGGLEGNTAKQASTVGFLPEWIVLGDGTLDGNNPNRLALNGAAFNGHAIVVTPEVYEPGYAQQLCGQAYREADRTLPDADIGFVCGYYKNLFQLFTGIQVAGPRLGPTSVDKGYHAIPSVRSLNNQTPACFYDQSDYTCVKDTQAEIWDNGAQPPGDNRPGCWRIIDGGKRYLRGEWPQGNIDAQMNASGGPGPCNGHNALSLTKTDPT